jgi:hypothetical protein
MFLSSDRKSRRFVGVFIFCKHCGWMTVEERGHTSKAHDKFLNNIVPLVHIDHSLRQHIRNLESLIGRIAIFEDVPPAAIAPAAVIVAPQQPVIVAPAAVVVAPQQPIIVAPAAVVVAPQQPIIVAPAAVFVAPQQPVIVAPAAVVVAPQQPGVISNNVGIGGVASRQTTQRNRSVPQAPSIEENIAIVSSQRPIRSNRSEINRFVPEPPTKKKGTKRARTSLATINPTINDRGVNDESFDWDSLSESTEENEFE